MHKPLLNTPQSSPVAGTPHSQIGLHIQTPQDSSGKRGTIIILVLAPKAVLETSIAGCITVLRDMS